MRAVTWSLVVWFLLSTFARAQSDWEAVKKLAPDATLRIKGVSGPRQVRGRFQSVDDVQLTVIANGKPLVLSRPAIRQIDLATGRRHLKKSTLLVGLGIGAALGALLGWVAGAEIDDRARTQDVLIWAGVGTAAGAIKGLIDQEYVLVYQSPAP
jgi:hypothetical protein